MRWVKASEEIPDNAGWKICRNIPEDLGSVSVLFFHNGEWYNDSGCDKISVRGGILPTFEWLDESISTPSGESMESQIQKQYAEKGNKLGEIVGTLPDLLTTPGESMEDLIKENYSCVCAEIYTRRDMVDPDCVYHEHGDTIKELMQRWASIQCKERDAEIESLGMELDALAKVKDYWYNRCYQAENFIEKSPCDPDITAEQIEAHKIWQESKKPNN